MGSIGGCCEVEEKWGRSTYQRWQLYAPDGREVSVAAVTTLREDANLEIEPQSEPENQEKAQGREQASREYSAFRSQHLTGSLMALIPLGQ